MAITSRYSPDVFTLVPMSALSKRHFDMHPIWSEFYDPAERDEIVSWGVERQWLDDGLSRMHDGDDHCAYPILQPYPLPDRMRLYVKARFETVEGRQLEGYVMNSDAYVVTIFADDDSFTFSRHPLLADLFAVELDRLKSAVRADAVFPLQYETDVVDREGKLIRGTFSAPGDIT